MSSTVREAAQALGISSAAARVRLHRARRALQSAAPQTNSSLNALMEAAS